MYPTWYLRHDREQHSNAGLQRWSTDADLELHFTPVLVKLFLELIGLPEVALQLPPHNDQPGQHCVHKPRQQHTPFGN